MKELATQGASDNVDDSGRGRIKSEYDALKTEIGKIAATTKFQGKTLVDGNFGSSVDTAVGNSTVLAAAQDVYSASSNRSSRAAWRSTHEWAARSRTCLIGGS